MTGQRPICSLSLDLDNQWSYMKTHGDAGWESFPSYLDLVVPRFLKILEEFGWDITVFVVGQDASLEKNREALQMIANAGHEIGNHSFNHEPWLHLYSDQEIENEIAAAEESIAAATEAHPRGFRGPGYSLSAGTLKVLARRRYTYDASTLPTYLGPLARAYYFMTSSFTEDQRQQRKVLFGTIADGFQPLRPYNWVLGDSTLLEIPVTTLPILKIPFHFSYLFYLSTFSSFVAIAYFRCALRLCRVARVQPSLLLHPLDFIGADDVPGLSFFPAMNLGGHRKTQLIRRFLRILDAHCEVLSVSSHADHCRTDAQLRRRNPP